MLILLASLYLVRPRDRLINVHVCAFIIYLFIINTVQTSIREYKAQIHARKQNVQHFRLYSWINTKSFSESHLHWLLQLQ